MHAKSPTSSVLDQTLPPATRATRLIFLMSGLGMSAWAPMVPYAKARLGLDDASLGWVLLLFGGGSMLSMPLAGWLVHRYGSRWVIGTSAILLSLALPMLAVATTVPALLLALVYFGVMLGAVDVAMNAHAVEVERRAQRPLMSGFHGLFSIGGLLGAALMSGLLALGGSVLASALVLSAILLLLALTQRSALLDYIDAAPAAESSARTGWRPPPMLVWVLGLLCFVSFMAEGSMLDWSALLLRDVRGVSAAAAGFGYALFSVAMAIGRLTGDAVIARWGPRKTVRIGAAVAAIGFAIAASAPWPALALLGFGLIGLGASNIVPVMFGAAGRLPGLSAGMAIATVTAIGYAGLLAGPALIGLVAHASSLPIALLLVAGLLLLVALAARILDR